MTDIYNNFTHPVILEDNRDPDVSWQHHLDRGSLGGVDLAYPHGSPVLASAVGVVTYTAGSGSGGWIAKLLLADGRYIEYMHLSSFSRLSGSNVNVGDEIALSGASGYGNPTHYGAHVHVHLYVGASRVNLFHHFNNSIEEAMYIRALSNGSSGYALSGHIYANDIGGHWRGITNLEGDGYIIPLSNQGRLNLKAFPGNDIELIFAVSGLWEQTILGAGAPNWSSGQQLIGRGPLTGRRIFPGAAGMTGTWHYPADLHA